jgi:hypothetical protein
MKIPLPYLSYFHNALKVKTVILKLYDFAWIRFGYEWNGFCDLAVVVAWQGARKEGRTSPFFSGWKTNTINSQFTQTPFVSSSRSSTSSLINQSLIHIIHH